MHVPKIINRENLMNILSFSCTSIISILTYVQQQEVNMRLMIIGNSISVVILSLTILVIFTLKQQRKKLEESMIKLQTDYDIISNQCMTDRSTHEPISNTPRTSLILEIIEYMNSIKINTIFFNKFKNQIELSLV